MRSSAVRHTSYVPLLIGLLAWGGLLACDHGLTPAAEPQGTIFVDIAYLDPGTQWPARDSLFDLRFVAMPFLPKDTADFLQLNLLAISRGLDTRTPRPQDTLPLAADAGVYVYSGVAENFADDLFAWRPVGLYEANGGVFEVLPGQTTRLSVTVDFTNRPPFPPQ